MHYTRSISLSKKLRVVVVLHLLLLIFILTDNGFSLGGSGTTITYNTQITRITQNNTPRSDKTHHTNLHNHKGHTTHNECSVNIIIKYCN
jgi:hypothetical protein